MRVPHKVTPNVQPSATPSRYVQVQASPNAFGAAIGRSLGNLGTAIESIGNQLQENRDQENRLVANRALSQFEIEQNQLLAEMARDAEPQSGIDMAFSTQFIEAADSLLSTMPDNATRDYAENQLLNLYRTMVISAQGAERSRNATAMTNDLNDLLDEARNIVLASPERLDEQVERLSVALSESMGVLSNIDIQEFSRQIIQGLVESSISGRILGGDDPELVRQELLSGVARSPSEAALIYRESGGNPRAINEFGYAGLYQFGAPQLQTLGVYSPGPGENMGDWSRTNMADIEANKWGGSFHIPGFPEIVSIHQFLNSPAAQAEVFKLHTQWMDRQIINEGLEQYIGQTVQGVLITREGLHNMIHLGGVGGAKRALRGEGNPTDAYGTSVLDYARMASGVIAAAGGVQAILTPQQMQRLISEADQEIAVQQRLFQQQVDALGDLFDEQLKGLTAEMELGYSPDFSGARGTVGALTQMAPELGAIAGAQLDFTEAMSNQLAADMRLPDLAVTDLLRVLEQERAAGRLSEGGREYHDLLQGAYDDRRSAAADDGYSVGVRAGVIEQAIPIGEALFDPQLLATRERQAIAIRGWLGPDATVTSPSERETLSALLSGDPGTAYEVMQRLASAPTIAREIQAELAAADTPEGMALAVALDLAAQGLENDTKAVLAGQTAINTGTGVPGNADMRTAAQAVFDTALEGLDPRVENAYLAAAAAHFVGTNPRWEAENAGVPNANLLEESLRAVLPGQIVLHGGGLFGIGGERVMTPNREIDQEGWNDLITELEGNPEWWRSVILINPVTRETQRLTEAPTYPNGDPIAATDFTQQGTIRVLTNGVYTVKPYGAIIGIDGMIMHLDLRNGVVPAVERPMIELQPDLPEVPPLEDQRLLEEQLRPPTEMIPEMIDLVPISPGGVELPQVVVPPQAGLGPGFIADTAPPLEEFNLDYFNELLRTGMNGQRIGEETLIEMLAGHYGVSVRDMQTRVAGLRADDADKAGDDAKKVIDLNKQLSDPIANQQRLGQLLQIPITSLTIQDIDEMRQIMIDHFGVREERAMSYIIAFIANRSKLTRAGVERTIQFILSGGGEGQGVPVMSGDSGG